MTQTKQLTPSMTSPIRCELDAPFLFAYRNTPDDWEFQYVVQPSLDRNLIKAIIRHNAELEYAFRPYFPVGIICLFPALQPDACYRHLSKLESIAP